MPTETGDQSKRILDFRNDPELSQPIHTTFGKLVWAVVVGNIVGGVIGLILWGLLVSSLS